MTKKAILVKKLFRAYRKKENWEYSRFKGYPEGTYFGYETWSDVKRATLKEFTDFYGKGLKKLRFKTL